jgi:hypothetical protein
MSSTAMTIWRVARNTVGFTIGTAIFNFSLEFSKRGILITGAVLGCLLELFNRYHPDYWSEALTQWLDAYKRGHFRMIRPVGHPVLQMDARGNYGYAQTYEWYTPR